MKSLILAASSVAVLAVAAPALAQAPGSSPIYGSLGYAQSELDDVSLGALQGRVGARLHPNFGVEGELAFGVKDDTVQVAPGLSADVELENQAAVYGVGFVPLSPNADLFARVGYGTTEVKASGAGASASADGQSWNYGVGGQYFFDGANGVRADWTRYDFEDDGGEADVWQIGYVRKF